MNLLTHLYLAGLSPRLVVGSLLPDLAKTQELTSLSGEIMSGITRHREIDVFADQNPIFSCSKHRLGDEFRRYNGILTDVFYGYFLVLEWQRFSAMPMQQFVSYVHDAFDECRDELPPLIYDRLVRLRNSNRLCANADIDGVRVTLELIGSWLRKPVALGDAVGKLTENYPDLKCDFLKFFPEMIDFVVSGRRSLVPLEI